MNILALILFLLIGGVVAWAAERVHPNAPRWVGLLTFVAAGLYLANAWAGGYAYANQYIEWIPRFGIHVILSMDGLSLMLVALTLFLGIVAVVSSWTETERSHGFFQFNILW